MTDLHRDFLKEAFLSSRTIRKNLEDDRLLDLVQYRTLKFFTDFAHPWSGMIRERTNASPAYDTLETVTTGGTGFGIMAMISAVERGWLPRAVFATRVQKIVDFLNAAQNHHGVFPHFMNGTTGRTVAFSAKDDGGDIVETSFLMMGLLSAKGYLGYEYPKLGAKIERLWENVEWSHHLRPEKNDFVWHWSPNHGYDMGHRLEGWNECLITYILATASPTHPIPADLYHDIWAKGKEFRNGRTYYGHELQLGPDYGGPLFLSHYSFLGINPRGLKDGYADYEAQTKAHAMIHYEYSRENPHRFDGYGKNCWGLTASDSTPFNGRDAYRAHVPSEDYGVIAPTAALSSFPYTPVQSMDALRHFYEDRGDRIFGKCGFADAFHSASEWVSHSHLAIDQAPIVIMIENYRSGLLWNIGMNLPEIQRGLQMLGFKSPYLNSPHYDVSGEVCALQDGGSIRYNQIPPAHLP